MNMRDKLKASSLENNEVHSGGVDYDLLNTSHKVLKQIDVKNIDLNPFQPRKTIDDSTIKDLSKSIKENGLIQPISVRKVGNGTYQLIAGERRLKATKLLGETTIYCVINDVSDKESAQQSLIENIDRENLSDLEIGLALRKMEGSFKSIEELAAMIGIARTNIYKYWSYEALPKEGLEILLKNPRVLSRKFSVEIKAILKSIKEDKVRKKAEDHLVTMLIGLVDNKLSASEIVNKLHKFKPEINKGFAKNRQAARENIVSNGETVGSFTRKGNILTISIKTEKVSKNIETDILEFIQKQGLKI